MARGKRTSRRSPRLAVPNLPPALHCADVVPFTRRYAATAIKSAVTITRKQFAGCLGGMAASTTVFFPWATSFRITRIIAWNAAGGSNVFQWWLGTAEQALMKDDITNTDLPTGITIEKPNVTTPPPLSYAANWIYCQGNQSDQIFTFSCASGTIIDIHGVYTHSVGGATSAFSLTGSGMTQGNSYYAPLDGATGALLPSGLPSTALS